MVEHGTEVLAGAFRQIEVLLRFVRSGPKAAQFHGVLRDRPAGANVSAFAAVLTVFQRAPGLGLSERKEAAANRVESFNRAAGAEIEVEPLYAFLAGFRRGGEGAFGSRNQTPFNQIGEFFSFRPRKGLSEKLKEGKKQQSGKKPHVSKVR
jgi:hypothetical protein